MANCSEAYALYRMPYSRGTQYRDLWKVKNGVELVANTGADSLRERFREETGRYA